MRNEKDLLDALFMVLTGQNEQKPTVSENEDKILEKYRDKEGYINVKNIKDVNELTKVFKIVDKKNYLESLENNKNIQDLADTIANDIKEISGDSTVNVMIETPTQTAYAHVEPSKESVEPICENKQSMDTEATTLSAEDVVGEVKEEKMVVLFNAGGMYNPQFYKSVLHICETQYFKEDDVYADFEIDENDKVDDNILLTNVWGKIYAAAADEFSGYLNAGEEVYIIDPETFELTKINNSLELWDYAMTQTQEEML